MFDKKIKSAGRKAIVISAAALVLVAGMIAGTYAILKAQTESVVNDFTAGKAPVPEIHEDFDDEDLIKKDVYISLKDDGGTGSYFVRVAMIFTLQDDNGNTVAKVPVENTDYTITMGRQWTERTDGYWYYNGTIVPGGQTGNLIDKCTTLNTEYKLVVDILAQTIQSNPTTAAQTNWGYVPGSSSTSD